MAAEFLVTGWRGVAWRAVLVWIGVSMAALAAANPIIEENAKPGDDTWGLDVLAEESLGKIKGYASATSVNKGGSITFYVSVNAPQKYSIDIYRMGWYGGAGGRLVRSAAGLSGIKQKAPVLNATTGLVWCPWTASYVLTIPTDWVSGIYFAKLTDTAGYQNYIQFAVRDDARTADFLYQQPVTTYQAYNAYPDDGVKGKSLYSYSSWGDVTIAGDKRAVKVSFDRPYTNDGAGFFFGWEHGLIMWLEREGYDVSYATDIDLHVQGSALIKRYKALISAGHDEYWSKQMYDAAVAGRNAGVDLAFMGSNAVFWQIRLGAGRFRVPNRVVVCYKDASIDPTTSAARKTILWRDVGRPEQTLIGVQYRTYNRFTYDGSTHSDYIVRNSDHWAYANSGFTNGDRVSALVGYEVDSLDPSYPMPANLSYTLLSSSPFTDYYGDNVVANSSIYQARSGAWVFATGTMSWSWGLNHPAFENDGIKQTTRNVLNKFLE